MIHLIVFKVLHIYFKSVTECACKNTSRILGRIPGGALGPEKYGCVRLVPPYPQPPAVAHDFKRKG